MATDDNRPVIEGKPRQHALMVNPFTQRRANSMLKMRREARVRLRAPNGGYFAGEIESGYCLDRPDIEASYLHIEVSRLIL
jgi:hypothetical protein